jgi:hypothetical protein
MQRATRFSLLLCITALAACKSGTGTEPPGPAAKLEPVSATSGAGFVATTLADSLVVRVLDSNGRPVPAVAVEWGTLSGLGSVSPQQSLTDANGRARSTWNLGRVAGEQQAFAQTLTVDGLQVVRFTYVAVAGPTAAVQVAPQGMYLRPGDTRQFTLAAVDQYGNAISGRAVAWSSSNPAAVTVNSTTGMATAVAAGVADITATTEGKSATARATVGSAAAAEDNFETNTLGLYKQYSDVPASWAIEGGVMTASGTGKQSHLIRNDVVFQDGWVEAEMDRADEGGLVLRFVDPGNLYLLSIHDDGSLLGQRNVEIFRRRAGSFELLAYGRDIHWPRGMVRTVRFEVVGSSLRGYVDGELAIQATDTSISGPGGVGMRYNDVPEDVRTDVARYLALRWTGF